MAPKLRWSLRTATSADVPLLRDHYREMWEAIGGHPDASIREATRQYGPWSRRELRSGRLIFWIAEAPDGVALGSGGLWFMRVHPRPGSPGGVRPYILSMYTAPSARGQGIASRIVREAVAATKRAGYPQINLHAAPMGRRIYGKLGFERSWEMRQRFTDPRARSAGRHPRARH